MEQKLMGHTVPAETVCGDSVVYMGPDKSVLILLKHCQDMKQQETRLRLISLLLVLSCVGLFIVIIGADLKHHGSSASSGEERAVQPSTAFIKQEAMCSTDSAKTPPTFQGLHIQLNSVPTDEEKNQNTSKYIKWKVMFGEEYDEEKRAIVIPSDGFYFVYLRFILVCPVEDDDLYLSFSVELHNWKNGYGRINLTEARGNVACTPRGPKDFFVGELFDFLEGDRINAWVTGGYKLITKSSFGAYLT